MIVKITVESDGLQESFVINTQERDAKFMCRMLREAFLEIRLQKFENNKTQMLMKSKMIKTTGKQFGSPIQAGYIKRTRINWKTIIVWSIIILATILSLLITAFTLITKFNK